MEFYCRENELGKLNKRYENGNWECVIIYGRRRVGKTALISEFCKGKPAVYFSALNSSSRENLEALSSAIGEYKNENPDSFPVYKSFDDAFSAIEMLGRKDFCVYNAI